MSKSNSLRQTTDIRPLTSAEVDDVCGGILPVVIGAALGFAVGFNLPDSTIDAAPSVDDAKNYLAGKGK